MSKEKQLTIRVVEAVKPSAEAYAKIKPTNTVTNANYQAFLDSNLVTPGMTMGDFRKAYEAYQAYKTNQGEDLP